MTSKADNNSSTSFARSASEASSHAATMRPIVSLGFATNSLHCITLAATKSFKKLMKALCLFLLGLAMLCGCASAYKPPQIQAHETVCSVGGEKDTVFKKAVSALLQAGYSIASSDEAAGFISTQRRQMALTPADVDVGSTMGIDYMKDKRTTVYVTVSIHVEPGRAVIRSDIDAEYLPNDPAFGKKMKGVSRGTVESRIATFLNYGN